MAGRRLRLRRSRRDETGAVAVEAALVFPVLILLVFGMIDFSFALRDYTTVTAATRMGSRIAGTSAGAGPGVCEAAIDAPPCTPASSPALAQQAADTIERSLSGVPSANVQRLLIYKANDRGFPGANGSTVMPVSCVGVPNCVVFTWRASANAGRGGFRYASGAWDSKTINACLNEQDVLGVFLQVNHATTTRLFTNSIPIGDRAVMRFEPLSQDTCKAGRVAAHP